MEALVSARLRLRPIVEADNPQLHCWRNDLDYLKMVSPKRAVVGFEKFVLEQKKAFETGRHLQFVVETCASPPVAVGTIYSFELNLVDGHVFVNTFIDERFRSRGYGPEASIILVCYLFDFFPLHKIYFEAFGYNNPSLSMIRTAGLKEEGVFKGHRFFGGERYDVVRFAAYRDSLDRIRSLERRFRERKI